MTAAIRVRLLAFLVIGALAVVHVGVRYADLDRFVRDDTYEVAVELAESGGLFDRAEVTYRGVPVGRVIDVTFRTTGVTATLSIDRDRRIPADLVAEVHNRSAVGEQYVDLIPRSAGGPYLAEGDVVPVGSTTTPVQEEELLASVDALVRSVDTDDLTTVVEEVGLAFEGRGDDLGDLIDNSTLLVASARESLPATRALLADAGTILATQDRQASLIASYLGDLSTVTGIVSRQDADVRAILERGARSARELRLLADTLLPSLQPMLRNLNVVAELAFTRQAQIEETLVGVPWALASSATPARDSLAHFALAVAPFPVVCHEGYLPPSQWRDFNDEALVVSPDDIGCHEGPPAVPRGVPRVID